MTSTYRVSQPRHGGQLRCAHLYGALARHADVEVLALVANPEDAGTTRIAEGFDEVRIPRSTRHGEIDERCSLAAGMPVTDIVAGSHADATPEYLAALSASLAGADAVLLAHPYLLPAVEAVGGEIPRIYDAHNVEAALKASVLPDTAAGRALLDDVRSVERRAVVGSACVVTCSEEDASTLRALYGDPGGPIVVVPNGTDASVPVSSPEERRHRRGRWLARLAALDPGRGEACHVAVFFASWHPPNLEAASFLLERAPLLPDVVFVLGGAHGDAFGQGPTPANVVLTGVVGDRVRDQLLGLADVAVNPMLSGSGTNLKVLEYLAHGLPVVSTRFGVRGLELRHGEHLLMAEPSGFPAAIRASLADPDAATERARRGRALVAERYDWRRLGERLARSVLPLLAR